jgi:hypothetical protein
MPGFAYEVLNRFTQHLTFRVIDPHHNGDWIYVGRGPVCLSSSELRGPDWPPIGIYSLYPIPNPGPRSILILLAAGSTPVYFAREELGDGIIPAGAKLSCGRFRDDYREQYVADMLGSGQRFLKASSVTSIEWSDEVDLRTRLTDAVEKQRQQFRQSVAGMVTGKWLTAEESASLKPRIEVLIEDLRADHSTPLPKITPTEGDVKIVYTFSPPLD